MVHKIRLEVSIKCAYGNQTGNTISISRTTKYIKFRFFFPSFYPLSLSLPFPFYTSSPPFFSYFTSFFFRRQVYNRDDKLSTGKDPFNVCEIHVVKRIELISLLICVESFKNASMYIVWITQNFVRNRFILGSIFVNNYK